MITNYFKTAFRNLRKHRLYSFINISGLTVGIAACILIFLYIQHELSYDNFHQNADRIARVTMEYSSAGTTNAVVSTGTKPGPQFKRTFPAIEEFVRTFKSKIIVKVADKMFEENNFLFADPPFFNVFSFTMLEGDPSTALDAQDKIVIAKSTAIKYFGTEHVMGRTIKVNDKDYHVSGITAEVPQNSQIKFDLAVQFTNLGNSVKEEIWWTANYITYILLKENQQMAGLQRQIEAYMQTKTVRQEARLEGEDYLTFRLEPLKSVHLYSNLAGFEPNGSIRYIYLFGIIALLILIIACANYVNLVTAQSVGRSGEIGIRKVMGASKKQVFFQFIGETFVIALIAAIISFFGVIFLLPYFNHITGKAFTAEILLQPVPVIATFVLAIIVSFLAGAYPGMVLSGTNIILVLKKGFNFRSSNVAMRKVLIVLQFGISVFLIIYTLVILQQMNYMRQTNLGYNRHNLVILPVDNKMRNGYQNIRSSISQVAGVTSITGAYETPEFVEWGDGISATDETGTKNLSVNALPVDLDFIQTMQMQLLAGRDFTESDFALMDTTNDYANYRLSFIINETTAKKLGWTPEQAIGKTIEKGVPGVITGVVKDFHFESLHEPIKPLVIFLDGSLLRILIVRVDGKHSESSIQQLGKLWKERVAHRPFEYHFLDEDYERLYQSEQRISSLFSWAAGLAILLACLGLFGLAAFTTVQRKKEIGIRRILGAGIGNITWLISTNFVRLVVIAIIIIVPVAWYAANKWLQEFAYRIEISWGIFIVAGSIAMVIAIVTVSIHAIKAAISNPVKSLRTE